MQKSLCFVVITMLILSAATLGLVSIGGDGRTLKGKNEKVNSDPSMSGETLRQSSGRDGHEPIRIDNDTDLKKTAQAEDWPGNGSEEAPYLIQG